MQYYKGSGTWTKKIGIGEEKRAKVFLRNQLEFLEG